MEGQFLSHYHVLQRLGGGGMGVVYKAEDTRLKRPVALKFLPPELTRDPEARERFVQEAQAASALDHPNICTIYEIDSATDGQLFIAMTFCDGVTLKKHLQGGRLPVDEAVDIAIQIARGLEKAHHAGIVHRDIKPANVMMTSDGLVKIVDFGIAKLLDRTGPTRTGTTLGTISYMSPEQINGAGVEARTDVWSLGVVLYEMLTGHLPFGGDHEMAILNAILNREPAPVNTVRPEVPSDLQRVVHRALAKRPTERYASAADLARDLAACHAAATAPIVATPRSPRARRRLIAAAALAVAAIAAGSAWYGRRAVAIRRAEEGIADVVRLAERDQYAAAVARAETLERTIPGDARLASLWPRISVRRAIDTTPAGALVEFKPYDDVKGAWRSVGQTPIADLRVPIGALRWRVAKDGFDTKEFIARIDLPGQTTLRVPLSARGSVPPGMVPIPGAGLALTLTGYDYTRTFRAGDFAIDTFEVSNKQFKEFVDAGGYAKQEYWTEPFVRDGRSIAWEQAVGEFRDKTGRPGPATWEVGTYPSGRDNYPVGGVSWYEAAAYARFAGKRLPTVYHWLRAAGVYAATYVTPLSNLDGRGPAPVGQYSAVGPFGTYDMAGNVKEWCSNAMAPGTSRYILGGGWNDPPHMFVFADARSPFDRAEVNGFRLAKYSDDKTLPEELTRDIEAPTRDFTKEHPVSDQVFEVFRHLYSYDPRPLDARVESVDATPEQWTKEKVTFSAAYGDERLAAYLFLPKNRPPPFETIVFAPGAYALQTRSSATLPTATIDYLLISGRAVIFPIYKGTYERGTGRTSTWPERTRAYQDWMIQVVNDARRAVDYLQTRPEIRRDAIAYHGSSWGAMWGSMVLALEPRFKAAVLTDGGLTPSLLKPPEVDQFNFAPRVTVPVLMVNGKSDFIYQEDISQKPLFTLLGTPADRKRYVVLPGGHGILGFQRSQVVREILDWLDRYLGPVQSPGPSTH